jgi:hypothetical protein
MRYPIPATSRELVALRNSPPNEEIVAAAIAGVIQISRAEGKSLDDVVAELLLDDSLLDTTQRQWLTQIVTQAWQKL